MRGRVRIALASVVLVWPALALALAPLEPAPGTVAEAGTCGPSEAACPPLEPAPSPVPEWARSARPAAPATPRAPGAAVVAYWREGCPRCEEAKPFLAALAAAEPGLRVEWVEVRPGGAGLARFLADVERLGVQGAGVPMFVAGHEVVVGFRHGVTEEPLRALVRRALAGAAAEPPDAGASARVSLPFVGVVDARRMPLGTFTLLVGLVDGVNPCAMYVLVVLLGILLHAGSRGRMALYGVAFVLMSGVVYFAFMTVWLGAFSLGGVSRTITSVLGGVLVVMGLVNAKDAVWLKKGPSLSVPDAAKPGLHRRMRAIASAATLPAGLAGVTALAFVVNLVELGCTIGLPAVYTRVLSLRTDLGPWRRAAYLALYNLAYVVPLALIVAVFVLTLRRMVLSERGARILKGVSGALLLLFGAAFLLAPGLLE
jgi:hypothetical protein